MEFPVMIPIGPWKIHPHWFFESLAYFIGFRVYLKIRKKDRIPLSKALWIVTGAVLGAALGSKLLYWLERPLYTVSHWHDLYYLMAGKTIVGALLGGLIGVEWVKRRIGWTGRTGDDFVFPLLVGMFIGRIGCFLTGLSDHTYGTATTWVIGVDFGDGIPRHPTQLYEMAFLLGLGVLLWLLRRKPMPEGRLFQWFMLSYLIFRFVVDFIKPTPHVYFGLNNIQAAALLGSIYYVWLIFGRTQFRREAGNHA